MVADLLVERVVDHPRRARRRSAAERAASITCEVMEAGLGARYLCPVASAAQPVGELLRQWRQRRRMSQLELALGAEVSARHVSFLETGRSVPSREMVLHLAERLEVPLR